MKKLTMIIKSEIVEIYPRKAKKGIPMEFRVHWDNDLEEYILCRGIINHLHFSIEECEDMLKILKEFNGKL